MLRFGVVVIRMIGSSTRPAPKWERWHRTRRSEYVLVDRGMGTSGRHVEDSAHIGFPVHCEFHGGSAALGRHGRQLWIGDGRIGHGELHLSHSIPLSDVASVEVEPRDGGGVEDQALVSYGAAGQGRMAHPPGVVTDITVRTQDGDEAAWVVYGRDVHWVKDRLAPALAAASIPFYGDPAPPGRPTRPPTRTSPP